MDEEHRRGGCGPLCRCSDEGWNGCPLLWLSIGQVFLGELVVGDGNRVPV